MVAGAGVVADCLCGLPADRWSRLVSFRPSRVECSGTSEMVAILLALLEPARPVSSGGLTGNDQFKLLAIV